MNDPAKASPSAISELQAQTRLVGLLREALPSMEVVTAYPLADPPQYLADIAVPRAHLVIQIKRRRDTYVVRQAKDQMARLASVGWTGALVFSNDPEEVAYMVVDMVVEQVHVALRGQP